MSDREQPASPEETTSPSPGSSEAEANRVRRAGQLWDSENVDIRWGPGQTGTYHVKEMRPAVGRRPDHIPAEEIPEPRLPLTPDVRESLDRIGESLNTVLRSLHEILESLSRRVGDLGNAEVARTGEPGTRREHAHAAGSRLNEERTPDVDATVTPGREPRTTGPGGASHTEALRSTDEP